MTNTTTTVSSVAASTGCFLTAVASIGQAVLPMSKKQIVHFIKTNGGFEVSPTALNKALKNVTRRKAESGDLAYSNGGSRPPYVYSLTAQQLQNMAMGENALDEKRAYGARESAPKLRIELGITSETFWGREGSDARFNGPENAATRLGWRKVWASPECLDSNSEWFEIASAVADYLEIEKISKFVCPDGTAFDCELKAIEHAQEVERNREVDAKVASGEVTLSRAALIAQLRQQFGDLPDAVLEFMLSKQDSGQDDSADEESA